MRSRKWAVIMEIFAGMLLCGCSLAVPGAETASEDDRLIGAFITSEHLDLFDMDAFLKDHAARLTAANEIQINNTSGYEQKLYAVIDKKDSEDIFDWDISFGDVEGISFFTPVLQDKDGDWVWRSIQSDGISDVNTSVNVMDNGNELSLSGTIYMVPGQIDKYYANPVFQTADGRIYLTVGNCFSTSGESGDEGVQFTTALSSEIQTTENGKSQTAKNSVDVSFATMHRPVKITLYQMDEDHQCLKQQEYTPGALPESLETEPGVAYLLAETEKQKLSGECFSVRIVYDRGEEEGTLETWYDLGNGILAKQDTTLVWK